MVGRLDSWSTQLDDESLCDRPRQTFLNSDGSIRHCRSYNLIEKTDVFVDHSNPTLSVGTNPPPLHPQSALSSCALLVHHFHRQVVDPCALLVEVLYQGLLSAVYWLRDVSVAEST